MNRKIIKTRGIKVEIQRKNQNLKIPVNSLKLISLDAYCLKVAGGHI
jgi:hypothetical protein